MNKPSMLALPSLILAFALPAAPSAAQTFVPQATAIPGSAPQGFNYQGRLEDNGFPVNATKQMVFRLYTADPGGVLLWTSPPQTVSVSLGLFNAVVPVPITALVGGGARYLEAQIDGTIMSPRELLNSVPYALIAKSVEGTIDVSTAGLAVNANSAATQPAIFVSSVTGNVGVGTSVPGSAFDVGGAASFGSAASKSTFTAAGALLAQNVSVGTGTAGALPLHVVQSAGGTNLAHFENTGSANVLEIDSRGGLNHVFNQIDGRFKLEPNSASGFGVTNHDYAGLALGSSGLYSAITAGGSTLNGGIRELYFWTNNDFSAPKMNIMAGGNVGIGTTGPATKLHLSSGTLTIDGNAATALTTIGSVGVGTANPGTKLHLSSGVLTIDGSAATALTAVGNVGIGTASPGTKLHVSSGVVTIDGSATNALTTVGRVGVGTSNPGSKLHLSSGTLIIDGNAAAALTTVGSVGVGTASPGTKLHMSSGTMTIDGNVATSVVTTGNVGVGTSSPNDRLDVAGGNLRITATAGSAGSVKLFAALTAGAVTCTAQCGANAVCLGAWTSAGVVSTCGTATAANRCLCSGFGD